MDDSWFGLVHALMHARRGDVHTRYQYPWSITNVRSRINQVSPPPPRVA